MEADPTAWEPPYNVGVSLVEAGRPAEAVDVLEVAEALAPDSGEVALALATVYDQLARPDDALVDALRALATLTDADALIEARFVAGRSAYRLGDYASAREDFDVVVAARPTSAPAQLWAGLAAYQASDFAAAVPSFERAVALDPADATARMNLGAAYLASERYVDAEAVYTVLLDADPGDAESSYHLGWALIGQDRLGPARDAWAASCEGGYRSACDALAEFF
jgi:tetratricopeptide (TPR) repeat protein